MFLDWPFGTCKEANTCGDCEEKGTYTSMIAIPIVVESILSMLTCTKELY